VIPTSVAEIASAVGGRLTAGTDPGTVVTGPVTADSRQVEPGGLFVALPGERVDGHDYTAAARARGAAAVLAARETGVPSVLVDDPLAAVGLVARNVLDRLPRLHVVGVTGSSGKTSTKDLIAGLLARLGPTVAPQGSFNNELGLPLTALRCDDGTRFLVAEMGARGPGHIAYLCGITPPATGVVTNVGTAHLGEFGSREAIAATKGELVEALPADGVAVLNADDPLVAAMASRTRARVVLVGQAPQAEIRAAGVTLDAWARPSFELVTPDGSIPVTLGLHGVHMVGNALAAAAVALAAGLPLDQVAAGLAEARPASRWRMEVQERPDGVVVVNDAYNANPDSARAALQALAAMHADASRRTWAVLGEMLELGPDSAAEHDKLGRLAAELGVDRVVAVGEGARPVAAGAASTAEATGNGTEPVWLADGPAALDLLRTELRPGDVVLLKASRGIGLDRLAAALLAGDGVAGEGVAGDGVAGENVESRS
jgi:UDP-N-acetylmuramoyl-tripeptide--D-alanyl-D-alanine ligase